ncbi:hypothetical protein BN2475_40056 [Paraburkholderia ribeironis]|uniref:Uncharacterized protein n=1 Tax=Paraburkholderia ribeironis TaxID=1247936 RepID=A0A1N7RJC5_9BURK|nr:hypothetical protein BN2475_40056 [Paraburkholderia ribeironis]
MCGTTRGSPRPRLLPGNKARQQSDSLPVVHASSESFAGVSLTAHERPAERSPAGNFRPPQAAQTRRLRTVQRHASAKIAGFP